MPPRSIDIPWRAMVAQADPDREREIRNELEYEFSNKRQFRGNPRRRGAYTPEED